MGYFRGGDSDILELFVFNCDLIYHQPQVFLFFPGLEEDWHHYCFSINIWIVEYSCRNWYQKPNLFVPGSDPDFINVSAHPDLDQDHTR